jgi:large repetitive protein
MATINGTGGNDSLPGTSVADDIFGGLGNDTLAGLGGADLIDGGDGIDTASYATASGGVTVSLLTNLASGPDGADTLVSIENLIGSNSADVLTGNGDANVLFGGTGNDTINGNAGDDVIRGGTGNDSLIAGDGIDTADYREQRYRWRRHRYPVGI